MNQNNFFKILALSLFLGLPVQALAWNLYEITGFYNSYNSKGKDKHFRHLILDNMCSRTGTYHQWTKDKKFNLSNLRPSIYEKFATKIFAHANYSRLRKKNSSIFVPKPFKIKLAQCKKLGRVPRDNMLDTWNLANKRSKINSNKITAIEESLAKTNKKFESTITNISHKLHNILDTHQSETIKNEVKNSINSDDLKAIIRQVVREELSNVKE